MTRFFDCLFSLIGLSIGSPVLILVFVIAYFDCGSPLFFQRRVGKNLEPFILVKFRTMSRGTESVASHLVDPSKITFMGSLLRRSKLDELPQLWNVIKGDMSLVGPRPCLFNQTELIEERKRLAVFSARPGITGLSQLSNIDMSTPRLLAETDAKMLRNLSISKYFLYIFATLCGKGAGDRARL